ncbi:YihA family ribosome biogenesis GTP-binding protein [Permianibacter sp. IMCC34836]|uniref:ribosome biogenesis GTP-binding protein YihA/YsxC n=1 Tax=Permianibacter fluminis TaxID=2738515 RepID=UPI001551A39C|nr:ribosome biogenesis GTP-binding protein YihA/YsxC [Permianibacter fluminis]NQD36085.1 YihA family ribosome biogenesis GTP-binding protein [Permianibacter fluminis]
MDYNHARFLLSAPGRHLLPADEGIEVAFAGRSNAGKSTALNALTNQKGLARTSKTPGRTQLINLFELDPERRLVDLPGYGYAAVSHTLKDQWQRALADYLKARQCLRGIVLLMDIRHPLTDHDLLMLELADAAGKPVHMLLTKADKLAFGARKNALLALQKELRGDPRYSAQLFSATENIGMDELKAKMDEWYDAQED